MGLGPSARITLRRLGEPCIVEVATAPGVSHRIGLNKPLAARLLVSRIGSGPASTGASTGASSGAAGGDAGR